MSNADRRWHACTHAEQSQLGARETFMQRGLTCGVSNFGIALTGPIMNPYQGSCYVSCNFGRLTRKMAPFWECFARMFFRTGRLIRLWNDYAGTGSILGSFLPKGFQNTRARACSMPFPTGLILPGRGWTCVKMKQASGLAAGCNCQFAGLLPTRLVPRVAFANLQGRNSS